MWVGQRVLCLLQDPFKQRKAPYKAFHANRNIPRCLQHLETVQVIEHSVVVNACKNSGNNYTSSYKEEYEIPIQVHSHNVT